MGIIVSCFTGCGREYLKNIYGDKIKILDATDVSKENILNHVLSEVDKHDIVFIPSDDVIRDIFNENNVDYDIFYPSFERRGEFIENQVRKRSKPQDIRKLDTNFEKWIKSIDDDESPNCYKHKLIKQGEFIGNTPIIMSYINSLQNDKNG